MRSRYQSFVLMLACSYTIGCEDQKTLSLEETETLAASDLFLDVTVSNYESSITVSANIRLRAADGQILTLTDEESLVANTTPMIPPYGTAQNYYASLSADIEALTITFTDRFGTVFSNDVTLKLPDPGILPTGLNKSEDTTIKLKTEPMTGWLKVSNLYLRYTENGASTYITAYGSNDTALNDYQLRAADLANAPTGTHDLYYSASEQATLENAPEAGSQLNYTVQRSTPVVVSE